MECITIWQAVLAELELSLSKPNFTTWFKNTGLTQFESGEAVICCPSTFTKAWIEKKYHTAIIKALESTTGVPVHRAHYVVDALRSATALQQHTFAPGAPAQRALGGGASPRVVHGGLNPRYTFEQFIVGKSNELAHAAAQAVSTRPGEAYNPLFVYGGVGLGKTHLMQAVGHEMLRLAPNKKVLYATCETFTNDFINAVRTGRAKDFKDRYRGVDILMIDDIQFLGTKVETQEEFFHTFNALHQDDKQIILTSDRPPKAIPTLESRLQSRFEWGMIVDIGFPDLETRIAILDARCRDRHLELSKDCLHHIASHIQNNIRELEGALNKIIAYIELKRVTPTPELVRSVLGAATRTSPMARSVTPKDLIRAVSEHFDLDIIELLGKSREKRLAVPRQIVMYLMREELRYSYPAIGNEVGGRDHTTAIHAYTKICGALECDAKLKQDVDFVRQRLLSLAG